MVADNKKAIHMCLFLSTITLVILFVYWFSWIFYIKIVSQVNNELFHSLKLFVFKAICHGHGNSMILF